MTNLTEEHVADKSFELMFALDEVKNTVEFYLCASKRSFIFMFNFLFRYQKVITTGGYREPINLQQIRTNMEMESHEEKLHNMIKISKMESAKDQASVAARAIKDKQKEQMRMGASGGGMVGIGSNSRSEFGASGFDSSAHSGSSFADPVPAASSPVSTAQASSSSRARQPVKGMSLNPAGAKNKSVEDALMREDKLAPLISASKNSVSDAPTPLTAAVAQQPVTLSIVEKVSATLSREGLVEMFEIKGSLTLTAADDEAALCSVQLKPASARDSVFSFNTHPKVNKAAYEKTGLLQLKEANKGFPSARPVGILKWTHSGTSEELVPLKINCWPEEESRGQMNVSIEYSMDVKGLELHDVRIVIPLGTNAAPTIVSVDGSHKHNASSGELVWTIDLIDASNTTGSLEFNVQQRSADAFFPIGVHFASPKLYSGVEVVSVNAGGSGAPVVYGLTKNMSSEEYVIN